MGVPSYIPRFMVDGVDRTDEAFEFLIESIEKSREDLKLRPIWFTDGSYYVTFDKRKLSVMREKIGRDGDLLNMEFIRETPQVTQHVFDQTLQDFEDSPKWDRRR